LYCKGRKPGGKVELRKIKHTRRRNIYLGNKPKEEGGKERVKKISFGNEVSPSGGAAYVWFRRRRRLFVLGKAWGVGRNG